MDQPLRLTKMNGRSPMKEIVRCIREQSTLLIKWKSLNTSKSRARTHGTEAHCSGTCAILCNTTSTSQNSEYFGSAADHVFRHFCSNTLQRKAFNPGSNKHALYAFRASAWLKSHNCTIWPAISITDASSGCIPLMVHNAYNFRKAASYLSVLLIFASKEF